jgi:hypothetical protein
MILERIFVLTFSETSVSLKSLVYVNKIKIESVLSIILLKTLENVNFN